MKDKIFVIALVCYSIIALSLISCARYEVKNIYSKGTNIICFGDSITFGYGVESGQDYPSVLSRMLNRKIINAGIDGDTTLEALKRLESDVLDKDPLLVIVEFGGNDFLRKTPLEETLRNIEQIIDKIQSRGAMVALADIGSGIILSEYRKAYLRIAQEKGAIFIPGLLDGIITNPQLKSDFLHPNATGYQIIAQRVYRAIISYLNQNTLSKSLQR